VEKEPLKRVIGGTMFGVIFGLLTGFGYWEVGNSIFYILGLVAGIFVWVMVATWLVMSDD